MKRWALIVGATVETVVESADAPTMPGLWVEVVGPFGTGDFYADGTFTRHPAREDTSFYVDVGPFFDRFGAAQLAALKSTDPDLAAFVRSCENRKWIWTKHPFVGQGIDRAIALGIAGVDAAAKAAIQNTPARWSEQSALIKLYFPEQEAVARGRA